MFNKLSRRFALKIIGFGAAVLGLPRSVRAASGLTGVDIANSSWKNTHDRVWLGESYWANPMEDWAVVNGAAECRTSGGDRNIQLLTHQLTDASGSFEMSVVIERVAVDGQDGGAGFRIGRRSELNEYRSNCFAKGGIRAGLMNGNLVLGQREKSISVEENFQLRLTGKPSGEQYKLTLTGFNLEGRELGTVSQTVSADAVLGNVSLVNNFNPNTKKGKGARFRFLDWEVQGNAFTRTETNKFGPILWSMYSLSDSRSNEGFVMKISALTGPLGERDNKNVELHILENTGWKQIGTEVLETDSWTAIFRVPNWNEKIATRYKLVYREQHPDGSVSVNERTGTIKANPIGRPLRLGALTCQNDYAFPYEPVADNLLRLDPDMLYFSGDQLYENHGGYGLIRDPAGPAILNYLRKFYQFGWSFGESMRDRPTICIPDDHDVFQGNLWGEGGKPMLKGTASSEGGYREPARMVNVVHRTCVGHHPDFFDPAPSLQDISVYFGDMVYGGVSFAILGDRQFKSGPEQVETGKGRADHVTDPNLDMAELDKPGLVLLGERQEKFLEHWTHDWRGHTMKVLLSQTVFAGVATHHGSYDGYLRADLDCGSWPQTPRNNAIRIMRKGMPLHINGDQHITSLTQYGVDAQRDSCWSFCTPAIAAGYPRWWRPDELGMAHQNRPKHDLADTGEFMDSFGNKVYVYAVGNPEVGTERNRYEKAHQKGSGFGLVTIDSEAKTYNLDSFRFLIDATNGDGANQFPGWPVTIHQSENIGQNRIG